MPVTDKNSECIHDNIMNKRIYVGVYVCLCLDMCVCLCLGMYVCLCLDMYVWLCLDICVCMCVYTIHIC